MAKVLVTGGAGYVGAHCVQALHSAGFECVVLDNLSTGHAEFVRWGPLIKGDIRDPVLLAGCFSRNKFDAVLHFAALACVGESVAHPELYYDVNIHGTNQLLQAMTGAGVPKIVFSSSCAVYGDPQGAILTETNPLMPVNPYGMSKLVCERMMDDFEVGYGVRSVRLRYFNAAGAAETSEIGEDHSPETHLIPSALQAVTGERPRLHLYGTDYGTCDGTAVRDYVHVSDLAIAHVSALQYLLDGGTTDVMNLGTGIGSSVKQVIDSVSRICGRDVPVQKVGRRPGDPAILVADGSRAKRVLGWVPHHSDLDRVVRDAWRWHLKRDGK